MFGRVTTQAMDQWNEQALQDRMLAGQELSSIRRRVAAEHPGARTDRRASGPAAECGWGDLDCGVVADALEFPSRVPCSDEGAVAVDGDVHRRADRRAITAIRREQDGILASDRPPSSQRCSTCTHLAQPITPSSARCQWSKPYVDTWGGPDLFSLLQQLGAVISV